MNWTPLTDAEEAEYQQLIQRANSVQRYGLENQKRAQAGLNVFEPHTLPGALAEAGGEMLPEMGLSLGLPELRLAHAAYWAGVSYLKARGSGASKAQAIGDAATAVAMLGASAPLSPLAADAGEGWRTALAKGATRGALGFGMGSALGAMRPGATPQSALSQGLQFGLMNLAGGGRGESEERRSVIPRDPELRGQDLAESSPGQSVARDQASAPEVPTIQASEGESHPGKEFVGSLYEKAVRVPGVFEGLRDYTKCDRELWQTKRDDFDGDFRRGFAKWVVMDEARVSELEKAGFSEQEIAGMAEGIIPPRYSVHHIDPLDGQGQNVYENLMLVLEDPFHKVLTNHQNKVTRGFIPGEKQEGVPWPDINGIVYPPELTEEVRAIIEEMRLIKAGRRASSSRKPRTGK